MSLTLRIMFFKHKVLFVSVSQSVTTTKHPLCKITSMCEILSDCGLLCQLVCYCNALSSDLQSGSMTNSLFLISLRSLTVILTNRCFQATAATSVGTYAFSYVFQRLNEVSGDTYYFLDNRLCRAWILLFWNFIYLEGKNIYINKMWSVCTVQNWLLPTRLRNEIKKNNNAFTSSRTNILMFLLAPQPQRNVLKLIRTKLITISLHA